jgi:hypothetical protein
MTFDPIEHRNAIHTNPEDFVSMKSIMAICAAAHELRHAHSLSHLQMTWKRISTEHKEDKEAMPVLTRAKDKRKMELTT